MWEKVTFYECPYCDLKDQLKLIDEYRVGKIKGVKIKYRTRYFHCLRCNEKYQNGALLDEALISIREAYDREMMKQQNLQK